MLPAKTYWEICKITGEEWLADKAPRLGAALAFYTVLSIGPLLLIAIGVAGLAFGQEAASGQIVRQIKGLIGKEGAEAVQTVIANSRAPSSGILATFIGLITLFVGATGVFGELQDALNTIWKVKPKPGRSVWLMVKERFLSFAMVLGIGFLLLVSLVVSALMTALDDYVSRAMPGSQLGLQAANSILTFGIITLLFAMIFKILPDAKINWRDVWIGAVITAALFTGGKFLIGLYLGRSAIGSTYGAAGSLVVLLVWIYYSAQILFFGAEWTQVYARLSRPHIAPADNAVKKDVPPSDLSARLDRL